MTARRPDNGLAYLVGVKPNEQVVESPHSNTLRCILDCFQRLAEYEDTGLMPEEIKDVQEALNPIPFGRFHDIATAEREGRLVILPCKVGDTVYVAVKDCYCEYEGDMNDCSCCDYVIMPCDDIFRYDEDEWQCGFKPHIREDVFCVSMYEAIGKTIFLTREEAEAALSKAGDSEPNTADSHF